MTDLRIGEPVFGPGRWAVVPIESVSIQSGPCAGESSPVFWWASAYKEPAAIVVLSPPSASQEAIAFDISGNQLDLGELTALLPNLGPCLDAISRTG